MITKPERQIFLTYSAVDRRWVCSVATGPRLKQRRFYHPGPASLARLGKLLESSVESVKLLPVGLVVEYSTKEPVITPPRRKAKDYAPDMTPCAECGELTIDPAPHLPGRPLCPLCEAEREEASHA